MGNCIGQQLFSAPQENARVLVFNGGGEEEFKASTPVKEIISGIYHGYNLVHYAQPFLPLPPKAKLESGEVYYLVPDMLQPCRPLKMGGNDSCRSRSIKIVVTKQQLEFLLRSRKKFQPKVVRHVGKCWGKDGAQKWQPSLATIPE
uniref:Uncharacterized protein n=1 Tax=Vitis vinifera TaxID=29760 RepID=A5B4A7_VITVI|nr:hypothetical protein VITISV_001457 [Vitis vinifera]